MAKETDQRAQSHNAEVHRLAALLRKYLAGRGFTVVLAARILRISHRNLQNLLSASTLPNGSTVALIEHEVAQGAGCSVRDVREAVEGDRAMRRRAQAGAETYAAPRNRIARNRAPRQKPEAAGRGRP